MSEKIGRRGLFGALAGIVLGSVAGRSVYEFAADRLRTQNLQLTAHGATIEIDNNGDITLTSANGKTIELRGRNVTIGGRDTRTAQFVGKLEPGDIRLHAGGYSQEVHVYPGPGPHIRRVL